MPLSMAKPGETVTIRKITGKDEVRQHLAELGFVVNAVVTVVSDPASERQPGSTGPEYGRPHFDLRGERRS